MTMTTTTKTTARRRWSILRPIVSPAPARPARPTADDGEDDDDDGLLAAVAPLDFMTTDGANVWVGRGER